MQVVPSLLLGIVGAVGIMQIAGDPTIGYFAINETRSVGSYAVTQGNTAGQSACVSSLLGTYSGGSLDSLLSLQSPGMTSSNLACYRGTLQLWGMVRTNYSSDALDTSGCERGYAALQWMRWFYATDEVDQLVQTSSSVRLSSLSTAVKTATLAALNAATCDGQTLLVTWPMPWSLATAVQSVVYAVGALGLVASGAMFFFVLYYRHHPMIRAASPLFLLLSLGGLVLLWVAGYALVMPVTTASCSAFSWLVNVGLQLTFSPLFAKTWRVYRIFGRRKLSVVAISNRRLLEMVGVLLALELLLCAVWQGVGNLQPQVLDVQTSNTVASSVSVIASRLQVNEYVQCGVPYGASRSMFIIMCVEKGGIFVWGALMAFSTRKVSSTFNEAQGITLAIYNTLFTIGIVAPIILVIQATGDVLDLLLAFALLWIAAFTTATLFGPKLMTVFGKHEEVAQVNTSVAASSSASGYAFLSLAALSTAAALQGYLAALKKHVTEVETRLAKIKSRSGSAVSIRARSPSPPAKALDTVTRKPMGEGLESRVLATRTPGPETLGGTPVLRPRVSGLSMDAGRGARVLAPEGGQLIGAVGRDETRPYGAGAAVEDSRVGLLGEQGTSSSNRSESREPQDSIEGGGHSDARG